MKKTCKELKRLSRGVLAPNWAIVILAFILIQLIINVVTMPFQSPFEAYYMQNMLQAYTELGIDPSLFEGIVIPALPTTAELIIAIAATFIISLISTILSAGQYKLHLSLFRNEKVQIKEIFSQFKYRPDRFILANLLLMFIQLACAIPLAVCAVLAILFSVNGSMLAMVLSVIGTIITYVLFLVLVIFFQFKYSQIILLLADHPDMRVMESFKESARLMKGNMGRYLYMTLSFIPMLILGSLSMGIGMLWVSPYMLTVQAAFYMDITGEFQRVEEESRRLDEEMGPMLTE